MFDNPILLSLATRRKDNMYVLNIDCDLLVASRTEAKSECGSVLKGLLTAICSSFSIVLYVLLSRLSSLLFWGIK